jgi:hypothetical protein
MCTNNNSITPSRRETPAPRSSAGSAPPTSNNLTRLTPSSFARQQSALASNLSFEESQLSSAATSLARAPTTKAPILLIDGQYRALTGFALAEILHTPIASIELGSGNESTLTLQPPNSRLVVAPLAAAGGLDSAAGTRQPLALQTSAPGGDLTFTHPACGLVTGKGPQPLDLTSTPHGSASIRPHPRSLDTGADPRLIASTTFAQGSASTRPHPRSLDTGADPRLIASTTSAQGSASIRPHPRSLDTGTGTLLIASTIFAQGSAFIRPRPRSLDTPLIACALDSAPTHNLVRLSDVPDVASGRTHSLSLSATQLAVLTPHL